MAKLLTGVSIENSLADHLQLERHGIADSMATEDLRAGVTAFFGGEKPKFSRPLRGSDTIRFRCQSRSKTLLAVLRHRVCRVPRGLRRRR